MAETALVTWTPDLLRARTEVGSGVASAAPSALLAGMGVGRLLVARPSRRIGTAILFNGSVLVAVIGWSVLWLSSATSPALLWLLLAGFGAGGHFPLGQSLLIGASDGGADRALGLMAIGLGCASGAGPFLLGAAADGAGIVLAFPVIPTCLTLALCTSTVAARRRGGVGATR